MTILSLSTTAILITSIGSVIGGMVGAYIIFILKKNKRKTINIYYVNNESNRGDDKETPGEPMHGKGEPATIDNKSVWKWTNNSCGVPDPHSLIYGPYSHDLNLPGIYRIEYLIMGKGFKKEDKQILILDVVGTVFKRAPLYNEDGSPILEKNHAIITKRYPESIRTYGLIKIRKKDLANGKWNKFYLDVYSDGTASLYEYKARTIEDYQLYPDEEVYFYTITVKRRSRLI